MRKKKILTLSGIVLGALMCFSFNQVQAIDSIFSQTQLTRSSLQTVAEANALDSDSKTLVVYKSKKSGNKYSWNLDAVGDGPTAYWITDEATKNDIYYCLNAGRGFEIDNGIMTDGAIKTYTNSFDMKDESSKSDIINNAGGNLGTYYNQMLWILDNSYISTGSNDYKESSEYKKLMQNAGISIQNDKYDLTEEQIEVVQQIAMWYFTNSNDTVNYHLSSGNLPSLYLNGKQLTDIYYETDEYGSQITGKITWDKMNSLFKYFINNASASYSNEAPSLSIDNSAAVVKESKDENYFIAGPFKLNGTNIDNIDRTGELFPGENDGGISLVDKDEKIITYYFDYINNEDGIYLKIPKDIVTEENSNISLELQYHYNGRTLTFLTDVEDPENTQPVVTMKDETIYKSIQTDIDIHITSISV